VIPVPSIGFWPGYVRVQTKSSPRPQMRKSSSRRTIRRRKSRSCDKPSRGSSTRVSCRHRRSWSCEEPEPVSEECRQTKRD
jgi:hypothetical protein